MIILDRWADEKEIARRQGFRRRQDGRDVPVSTDYRSEESGMSECAMGVMSNGARQAHRARPRGTAPIFKFAHWLPKLWCDAMHSHRDLIKVGPGVWSCSKCWTTRVHPAFVVLSRGSK